MTGAQDPLAEAATRLFGVRYLYPVQRYVISNTLEGRSQIVVLPTGAGKSLCFQLPSQLVRGVTVVLVPIVALLADQVRGLEARGVRAGVLRGGQDGEERAALRAGVESGEVRIVYATPEVMLTPGGRGVLRGLEVATVVVDEAHCVSEWGDTFRPAYLEVGRVVEDLAPRSVTALTATASPEILARVRRIVFGEREVLHYVGDPDRPNLTYAVVPALSKPRVVETLALRSARPLVIFGRSRRTVERYARLLRRRLGEPETRFYHAGLDRAERSAVEAWFLPSRTGILAATCAYGMGVDKPDIRTVIHVDVPLSVEAYLQETGRAGRDGEPSAASLVWSGEDVSFAAGLSGELERHRYASMLEYAAAGTVCRRAALLGRLGVRVEHCSGCDVCAGCARLEPEGRAELLAAIRTQRRRFSSAEAVRFLAGDRGYWGLRSGLSRYAGYGALEGWRTEDVEIAVNALELAGELRCIPRGPWKGRLTVRRPREPMPAGAPSP